MAKKVSETPAVTSEPVEAVQAAAKKGYDQSVAALKEGVTGAMAGFEKTQMEAKANMEKAMKTAEEFATFGQGNFEAVVKSGQIWAAGVQDLGKSFAATAQAQMDAAVSTMKALATVKSVKEAFELQSALARSSVESMMAETGKLTDASMKLAEQAFAPITARVTLAAEKFGRAA